MMYRARRSFVDPFTGRVFLRGKSYSVTDERHANYLERHGLIERVSEAPVEMSAGAGVSKEEPKRRKRGGNRDNFG
jgi:hypothetical protein